MSPSADTVYQLLDNEERTRYENRNCRSRGRPSVLEEKRFTYEQLLHTYRKLKAIRKVATHYGVSPTTVKKYLKGQLNPPGRPPQPQAWKARLRTPIHAWFVENRHERLPASLKELSELSGFSSKRLGAYLAKRRKACFEYVKTLPEPTALETLYVDTNGRKVPTSLIDQYTVTVDKFNLDLWFRFVLLSGTQRTVVVPLREYLALCAEKETPGATGSSV